MDASVNMTREEVFNWFQQRLNRAPEPYDIYAVYITFIHFYDCIRLQKIFIN